MEPNIGELGKEQRPLWMTNLDMEKELLSSKLREIYPEVEEYGLSLDASFVAEKDAWIITLAKGRYTMTTHLEKKDAEACLAGIQCVYLGVQIGQFIANFKEAAHLAS